MLRNFTYKVEQPEGNTKQNNTKQNKHIGKQADLQNIRNVNYCQRKEFTLQMQHNIRYEN
jgi:hypothetical protein